MVRMSDNHEASSPKASSSRARAPRWRLTAGAVAASAMVLALVPPAGGQPSEVEEFDVLLRHGTVVDGSGADGFEADVGIRADRIVKVGDLSGASAEQEIDVSGLVVAPGFIDIHSHASTAALREARSSLTQGVTTELLNPDGGGSLNIAERLSIEEDGLGINVGAYTPFNGIWSNIVGSTDRRATEAEMERMRGLTVSGMANGAWGVSLGLDYTPGFYAETDQVIGVVEAARNWRTNTPSHIRNEDVGVLDAVAEHIEIGETAGLVPVITHHKVMNCCWGQSVETLELLDEANERGTYAVMDQYPYLAAQTGLTWIVPRWALEGGREAYLERFADPELRPQIEQEIHGLIEVKVGVAENVFINAEQRTLADIAEEMDVTAGEATMRVVEEHGNLSSVWTFGHDDDVERIMQHPLVAVASDGGATTSAATHPRRYGTQPRVLGRYVREKGVLELEEAVYKMTGLPATIIGMVDRGYIEPGMAADLTVFDPETIIDHATFEEPRQFSEGVEHVLVNGVFALQDGELTGAQPGKALRRESNEISRPATGEEAVSAQAHSARLLPPEPGPDPDGETFATDFSDDTLGEQPAGWSTRWNAGGWTVQDDPRRLNLDGSTLNRQALVWDEVGDLDLDEDVEVYGRVRGTGHMTLFHVGMSISGEAGDENAYVMRARTDDANGTANQLQLGLYREGSYATLDSAEMPFTVEEDTWYRVLVQRDGDWLRGKMWPDGEDEPADWQVKVHENRLLVGGYEGGGVGPLTCCSGSVMDWSYLAVGTDGERAPRLPDETPIPEEQPNPVQFSFRAAAQGGDTEGTLVVNDRNEGITFRATEFGKLQTSDGWASVTGRGQVTGEEDEITFLLTLDEEDPLDDDHTKVTIHLEGGRTYAGQIARGNSHVDNG